MKFKSHTYSPGYNIIHREVIDATDQVSAFEISKKSFEQKFPGDPDFTISIKEMTDDKSKLPKAKG